MTRVDHTPVPPFTPAGPEPAPCREHGVAAARDDARAGRP